MVKKFTHKGGLILLNHEDTTLPATVIAMAAPGWATFICSVMNRSEPILKMVKGKSA